VGFAVSTFIVPLDAIACKVTFPSGHVETDQQTNEHIAQSPSMVDMKELNPEFDICLSRQPVVCTLVLLLNEGHQKKGYCESNVILRASSSKLPLDTVIAP
jgi:hypothetical protein